MHLRSLARAYGATPVGHDDWVIPDREQTLEDFEIVVAVAEAFHATRHIEILDLRPVTRRGRSYIRAIKFQRLR